MTGGIFYKGCRYWCQKSAVPSAEGEAVIACDSIYSILSC